MEIGEKKYRKFFAYIRSNYWTEFHNRDRARKNFSPISYLIMLRNWSRFLLVGTSPHTHKGVTAMERFTDLIEWFSKPHNTEFQTRRWGVEIETPSVSGYARALQDCNWDTHTDESVTYPDCECSCGSCVHDCDCPNCEITNGWNDPDHCGDCQHNEAASPVMFTQRFSDEVRRELQQLDADNSEDYENGGHIHIEARDLTLAQVGLVQKAYLKIARIMPSAFGRDYNHFAKDFTDWEESHRLDERYCAVNATNLVRYAGGGFGFAVWADDPNRPEIRNRNPKGAPTDTYKTTLEFRQFASTANPSVIEARAALMRSLVDYIASGGAWYWLARCESQSQILELLQPQHH